MTIITFIGVIIALILPCYLRLWSINQKQKKRIPLADRGKSSIRFEPDYIAGQGCGWGEKMEELRDMIPEEIQVYSTNSNGDIVFETYCEEKDRLRIITCIKLQGFALC